MNRVILCGRFTRDAEVRYGGANNSAVARFTMAVDRDYKREGEQNADFISCVAFGKTAEFLDKYGRKGTKFIVEGRIQTGSYTNKDNVKVYTTDVIVEHTEFAESKNNQPATQTDSAIQTDSEGFMYIPEDAGDELPFN